MLHYLVMLGSAANFLGTAVYTKDTLTGQTKPNRVTFLLWSLAPFIGTAAALSADGLQWAILPVFMAGACPFMILLASFLSKKGYWKLRSFDYVCGAFSVIALVLWKLTHQPDVAIAFAIASDALAALPTIRKSWSHPHTETLIGYIGGVIAPVTSFFVIQDWKFSEYAFPTYLVAVSTVFILIIYYRRATLNAVT